MQKQNHEDTKIYLNDITTTGLCECKKPLKYQRKLQLYEKSRLRHKDASKDAFLTRVKIAKGLVASKQTANIVKFSTKKTCENQHVQNQCTRVLGNGVQIGISTKSANFR